MRQYNCSNYKKIAILGSFGKHYNLIVEIAKKFIDNGFEILVPNLNGIKKSDQSFLLLEGDESNDPKELENEYIKNCLRADLVYVCDKDGYIGTTVAFELGMLSCYNQEIFFMEKPSDKLFVSMIQDAETSVYISSPDRLIKFLQDYNSFINSVSFFDDIEEPNDYTFSLSQDQIINVSRDKINSYLKKEQSKQLVKKDGKGQQ